MSTRRVLANKIKTAIGVCVVSQMRGRGARVSVCCVHVSRVLTDITAVNNTGLSHNNDMIIPLLEHHPVPAKYVLNNDVIQHN